MTKSKSAHLSIDDTIWLFENLGHFNYSSIFEQPLLAFLRGLHEKYGIVVSCYCFGEFQGLSLSAMTDMYRLEFEANSEWLRFGFHAKNDQTRYANVTPEQAQIDYTNVINELSRVVGTRPLDHFPRLHFYSGSKEGLSMMVRKGLIGLLCSEDFRDNYYLSGEQNVILNTYNSWVDESVPLRFLKTDLRIEHTENITAEFDKCRNKNHLEVFTHEWGMNLTNMTKLDRFCRAAFEVNYQWIFPEGL